MTLSDRDRELGYDVFGPRAADDRTGSVTLGVMLPTFGSLDGKLDPGVIAPAARCAEDGGLDGLWVGDHLVHPLPLLESVVTLEHIASTTHRVRIGTSVMLLALRSVLATAKQLATIAIYHPGRLTIGVGVGGEHPTEFRASGIPLGERGERLEEAAVAVRELCSGEPIRADGRFNDLQGLEIAPCPPRIPLLFGGHTDRALRRAATLGDAWVGFYKDVGGFAAARDLLLEERQHVRPSEPFPLGMVLPTVIGERNDEADRRAGELMKGASTKDFQTTPSPFVLAGTPERILERVNEYHAAGCGHFILALLEHGDAYMEQLALACEQVLPGVRSLAPVAT